MTTHRDLDAARETSYPGRSDEWVHRLRRGDAVAVERVRERIENTLSYRRLGIPETERADVEQEIMTQIWQAVNRPEFDASGGFWGFVETVTARRCIDWLRSRKPKLPLQDSLQDRRKGPLQQTLDEERRRLATAALAQLDPRCRQLILLHLDQGKSYKEIADELGSSEGALRVQMYRCIRNARKSLAELRRLDSAGPFPRRSRP